MPWNELQCVVLSIAKEYVQRTTYNPSINGNKCSGDRNRIAPTEYKAAKNGKKYWNYKKKINDNNGTKKKWISQCNTYIDARQRTGDGAEGWTPFLMSNFTIDCTIAIQEEIIIFDKT